MADTQRLQRPRRWDRPFDAAMEAEQVSAILAHAPFCDIDPTRFPASLPLHGVLANDAALRRYRAGDLVCVRGEYGHSAYFILDGAVQVLLGDGVVTELLGSRSRPIPWWRALAQLFTRPSAPEVRDLERYVGLGVETSQAEAEHHLRLTHPQEVLAAHESVRLEQGAIFGEIAALARVPRSATVMVEREALLLEVRWQGLRELHRYSPPLRALIDDLYRRRSLLTLLLESPLLSHLDEGRLAELAAQALFENYGDFEWQAEYARDAGGSRPRIASQGDYADGVLLISGGFALLTERRHSGERSLGVLRRGDLFGLEEAYTAAEQGEASYTQSLSALGYTDLVRLPSGLLLDYLPARPETSLDLGAGHMDQALFEFFVEHRYINGTRTMLVDLDRCVRCDDCVHACSRAHGGNPRFLREGRAHDRFMVAEACMHCTDPVCMIGCPTGAIQRERSSGFVTINDPLCIGCGSCAGNCPFDAIRMVELSAPDGTALLDQEGNPLVKASKCDYCFNQPAQAQCEQACPHDALKRVDMRDLAALAEWLQR